MANIEKYLPDRFAEIEEFMSLCKAENPEFDNMGEIRKKWLNNRFPKEADLDGIKLYEEILEIKPLENDTIEDRRFRILTKLNERLPYTWIQLHRMLAAICGWDGYELKLEDFIITVYLSLDSMSKTNAVLDMLRDVLPMSIFIDIEETVEQFLKAPVYSYYQSTGNITIVPFSSQRGTYNVNRSVYSYAKTNACITLVPMEKLRQKLTTGSSLVSGAQALYLVRVLPIGNA